MNMKHRHHRVILFILNIWAVSFSKRKYRSMFWKIRWSYFILCWKSEIVLNLPIAVVVTFTIFKWHNLLTTFPLCTICPFVRQESDVISLWRKYFDKCFVSRTVSSKRPKIHRFSSERLDAFFAYVFRCLKRIWGSPRSISTHNDPVLYPLPTCALCLRFSLNMFREHTQISNQNFAPPCHISCSFLSGFQVKF